MTLDPDLQTELRRTAHACADAAAGASLHYFRALGLDAENKGGEVQFDPVTEGDRAAERAMREVLAELRPDDGILGEEEVALPSRSGFTWVLDPIDGTRGYLAGTPTWGTLIAVNAGAAPLFGIIDQPYIGERFEGGFGLAQMKGPRGERALRTRSVTSLSDAIVFSTFPEIGTDAERTAFHAVAAQARLTRYGIDCYGYALVAAGHADLVIEAGLEPYDVQGPIAVIEASGGVITTWDGRPAHDGGRLVASANKTLHDAVLAELDKAGGGV